MTPRSSNERTVERIAQLLETVQAFAAMDFSRHAPVGTKGDDLDALAAGINMLGEEIQAAQDELEARVNERTLRLAELTRELETEVAERKTREAVVRETNERLQHLVGQLERLNREVETLAEMSNRFQLCAHRNEVFSILGQVGPELFPDAVGTVFMYQASRNALKPMANWGGTRDLHDSISLDSCWAVRRGHLHRSGGDGPCCSHLSEARGYPALCVPLVAEGETRGLLSLCWAPDAENAQSDGTAPFEKLAVAAAEQIALALANLDLRAALQAQSIRDPLTNLYNRRFMDEALTRELHRADRNDSRASFMMTDIDHFKHFNDTYGHDAGDTVLREVARRMRKLVRGEDVACRFGGEEFAVVMGGARAEEAARRAEDLRAAVSEVEFSWHGGQTGTITLSAGVATYPDQADSRDSLVRAADRALYAAKERGRNRVVVFEHSRADGGSAYRGKRTD